MKNTVAHQFDGVAHNEWLPEKIRTGETIIKGGVRRRVVSVRIQFGRWLLLGNDGGSVRCRENTAKGSRAGRHAKEGSRLS